jgi:hypothetical protein
MTDIVVNMMVELFFTLALVAKQMKQDHNVSPFSLIQYLD